MCDKILLSFLHIILTSEQNIRDNFKISMRILLVNAYAKTEAGQRKYAEFRDYLLKVYENNLILVLTHVLGGY